MEDGIYKKQRLLDSILRSYDLPKFYLAPSSLPEYEWELVDGQQRIRAILDFFEDLYPLGDDLEEIDGLPDISGKKYSDLPTIAQERIGRFELSVTILTGADRHQLEDLFRRLQDGVRITPTEYRNAIACSVRDFVVENTEPSTAHSLFGSIKIKNTNWKWRELLDIVTCLERHGSLRDVKARDLQEMYEDGKFEEKTKKKVLRVLGYMAKVIKIKPSFFNIKWGFVDLYWLISSLIDRYDLKGLEGEFASFYHEFEGERRKAIKKDLKELVLGSDRDKKMFDYIESFQASPGTKGSLERRHEAYIALFFKGLGTKGKTIASKDSKRNFDSTDRSVVWYMADETCSFCGRKISLEEMQVDHITPHARGGLTVLENSQCLCGDCNRQKGAKMT